MLGVLSSNGATVFPWEPEPEYNEPKNEEQNNGVTVVGTDGSSAVATKNIVFKSAEDSNVEVIVRSEGENAIVEIGVYYK